MGIERYREAGQEDVPEGVREEVELPRQQRIQEQHARDIRDVRENRALDAEAASYGQEVQRLIEDELQKERHPEGGEADRAYGEYAPGVV